MTGIRDDGAGGFLDAKDPEWGPYKESIESALASCTDYLRRLRRSLANEIAPDRHYFNHKAVALEHAARDLVRRGQEIDRFLGECRADVAVDDGLGGTELDVCNLPVGHKGSHRPEPLTPSPVSDACNRAQDLADRAGDVAWRLGWLSAEIDHRDPSDKTAIPDQREQLRDLLVDLDNIAGDAKRLTTTLDTADQLLQADARHTHQGPGRPALSAVPDLGL